MRASQVAVLVLWCALSPDLQGQASSAPQLSTAIPHGNTAAAGRLADGVLALSLTAKRVRWHPEADDGPAVTVDAFAADSSPASIPGPLVRVPAGTRIESSIRNGLDDTLLVFGLSAVAQPAVFRIAAGETADFEFTASVSGALELVIGDPAARGLIIPFLVESAP